MRGQVAATLQTCRSLSPTAELTGRLICERSSCIRRSHAVCSLLNTDCASADPGGGGGGAAAVDEDAAAEDDDDDDDEAGADAGVLDIEGVDGSALSLAAAAPVAAVAACASLPSRPLPLCPSACAPL
mmetsp:Transcript_9838/g.26679  ORF Transcript_9838/g.26679 Transcript_9838/m.26679 type:complete len:128 (+) Transcript_9838:1584-1967(+)